MTRTTQPRKLTSSNPASQAVLDSYYAAPAHLRCEAQGCTRQHAIVTAGHRRCVLHLDAQIDQASR